MTSKNLKSGFYSLLSSDILNLLNLRFILFIGAFMMVQTLWSQELTGHAIDKLTGEPVSFASIRVNDNNVAVADSNGIFHIKLAIGISTIGISKIGYVNLYQNVRLGEDDKVTIVFQVERYANELEKVVISSSKLEKEIAREAVSIVSIDPTLIANTNSNTLSDVLNRVPGVSIVDGQAIIRGGVGWSYNVGSRVMVLLDDLPLMGPDAGDVQWDLLPIEAATNIEVMKGPASVLYGSSASNGTVSVHTGWPTKKPETKVQWYQGITSNPIRKHNRWWENSSQPFNTGAFFSHKQKYKQLDLVFSGNLDAVSSYIQFNDQFRARTYLKTRYRFKSLPGLSAGINGTFMVKKGGRFFVWKDSDSNNLRPYDGSSTLDNYRIWTLDPHVTYTKPGNYTLALKLRHYQIIRFADFEGQQLALHRTNDAVANQQAMDINFQKIWFPHFTTTAGIYLSRMWAVGNVYPGNQSGYSAAAFVQGEYVLLKDITLTAGLRYEVNAVGNIEQSPGPLLRGGINYKAASKTYFRATYGEGFRFPTVSERYIDDYIGGIAILPSPDLKNEYGWYTEIGLKQGFRIGNFNGTVDGAFFWQEYENLIQFQFNQWKKDSFYIDYSSGTPQFVPIHGVIGFKAVNLGYTRAAGIDLSLEGAGNIGEIGIRTLCGYTYVYPVDLEIDPTLKDFNTYMKNLVTAHDGLSAAQINSILPYRNRKLVKLDMELSYKKISVGYGAFYYSIFEKIDEPLYVLIPGIGNFLDDSAPGDWVHNLRFGFALNQHITIAFLVNNITNHEYAIRLAKIDPPRNYNLQLRLRF